MNESLRVAGSSVRRVDGVAKVTGAARFAIDLTAPGTAYGAVVRSERAHARVANIDTSEAKASPGVIGVVTGEDLGGLVPYFGHIVLDHPILALDRVRYYGEPVALVVAQSRREAEEAADAVRVDYDDLPAVIDALDALAEDAPVLHPDKEKRVVDEGFDTGQEKLTDAPMLHPGKEKRVADEGFDTGGEEHSGNLCSVTEFGWGDVDLSFETADVIVEGEYRYPMLYGYAMEPYNALAFFEAGGLTVYSTAQHPYMVRSDLARIFSLPASRVRVVVPYVGGGYGTKSYTKVEPLAAVGAWFTGRPVRVACSVEESVLTTRSDSALIKAKSGFASDGTLVARQFDIVLNSGAYSDNSPQVARKAANRCFGPYKIPALSVRVRSVFTNTVPASSLRGFGAPQGNLAGELQMDEAAAKLGLDPVELRLRNLVGPGEELLPSKRPLDANLAEDLKVLAKSLGWPNLGEGKSIGLGLSASDAGAHPASTAAVRIHDDGSVSALVGATELGQGSQTVLAQIVAEELGVSMDRVTVASSDTGVTPFERTTGASRTTAVVGRSLQAACKDARRRVRELAAETAGVDAGTVGDSPGGVRVKGEIVSFEDVIRRWFGSGGEVMGTGAVRRGDDFEALPPFWEIGATGVVLSVDRDTGKVHVDKLATVGDVGFAINPALVHGQDAGAAMMGLGAALSEELVYDGDMLANPNVVDYRVPRFGDLPKEMDHILAERRDGIGPYGAKGGGEGAVNPMGGAVAAAIGRAVGLFPHELPATPERVWRLIHEAQNSALEQEGGERNG